MKIIKNAFKLRNPETKAFETIAGFLGKYIGIHVGKEKPTNIDDTIWIDTSQEDETMIIPEVKDNEISSGDTWSSQKISEEIGEISSRVEDDNTYTVTGNPVQFERVAPLPINVSTEFRPKQNKTYGDPYPAGGGRNLLNYDMWKYIGVLRGTGVFENNGVTITALEDDAYTNDGIGWPDVENGYLAEIPVNPGESITLSWEADRSYSANIYIFPNADLEGLVVCNNVENRPLVYTATEGVSFVTIRFSATKAGDVISYRNIMVNKGTQALPFEPYSNIRPISGWTGLDMTAAGKNLFRLNQEYDYLIDTTIEGDVLTTKFNSLGGLCVRGMDVYPAGTHTLSIISIGEPAFMQPWLYYADNYEEVRIGTINTNTTTATFTADRPFRLAFGGIYLNPETAYSYKVQLELGSTATPYEPYQESRTYLADFGKNLLSDVTVFDTVWLKGVINLTAGTTYTVSVQKTADALYFSNEGGTVDYATAYSANSLTYTPTTSGIHVLFARYANGADLTYNMMLELGSTATSYVPHNAELLAKTGGVVYGGKMDWNAGNLKMKYGFYTFDGTLKPYEVEVIGEFSRIGFNGLPFNGAEYLSNNKDGAFSHGQYRMNWGSQSTHAYVNGYVAIVTLPTALVGSTIDSVTEYITSQYAAGTPLQIAYRLLEDEEIQLTSHELESLKGINTIYGDGEITVSGKNSVLAKIDSVQGNLENAIEKIGNTSAGRTYTLGEIKTNDIWVDGSPIYRNILEITGTNTAGESLSIPLGDFKFGHLILLDGGFSSGEDYCHLATTHNSSTTANVYTRIRYAATAPELRIVCGSGRLIGSGYAILEYTKTTN